MAASKLDRAKDQLKNLRKRSKEAKSGTIRRGSNFVGSITAGYYEGAGKLDKLPHIPGLPAESTILLGGLAGAMFLPGALGDVAEGLADQGITLVGRKLGIAAHEAMADAAPAATPVRGEDVGADYGRALPPLPAPAPQLPAPEPSAREAIAGDDYDDDEDELGFDGVDPYEAFLDAA